MTLLDPIQARILLVITILFILFSIYHILKHQESTIKKIAWLLFTLIIPIFGSLIYFVNFLTHRKKFNEQLT